MCQQTPLFQSTEGGTNGAIVRSSVARFARRSRCWRVSKGVSKLSPPRLPPSPVLSASETMHPFQEDKSIAEK